MGLIADSISLLVIGLLYFLFLHDSVLAGSMFLGIFPTIWMKLEAIMVSEMS
jgi:hypothetical protein